ncbi:DUF983 domain-containing protein [Caulobacter sp. S45]|uniref:DUF983 domain-containing protein n=1 Tax=Caulobacter sp. S45 TaxID=1641861 RepID=UPI00131E853E|nr:DUF983 domain-containing protein [Caulobacter sp. S45]
MSEPLSPALQSEPNRFLQGMVRGLKRRCPNCGEGALYAGYLKIEPTCLVCGHDNSQYRADDAGPYFTILIVGHIAVGPLLFFPFIWKAPVWWVVGTTLPFLAVLTLLLLPRVKGAVIGVQWAQAVRKSAVVDLSAGGAPPPA